MFSRRIAAVAAVLIALGGAVSVAKSPALLSQLGFSQSVAQTPSPQLDRGRGGWFKELNLTPDQLKKFRKFVPAIRISLRSSVNRFSRPSKNSET